MAIKTLAIALTVYLRSYATPRRARRRLRRAVSHFFKDFYHRLSPIAACRLHVTRERGNKYGRQLISAG